MKLIFIRRDICAVLRGDRKDHARGVTLFVRSTPRGAQRRAELTLCIGISSWNVVGEEIQSEETEFLAPPLEL